MSLKPAPNSPDFENSVFDWISFTESVDNISSFPYYAGKKQVILCNGTGTVYLPERSDGFYHVKNIGTGTITVEPLIGTIDGATSKVMSTQYESIHPVFDGENWYLI